MESASKHSRGTRKRRVISITSHLLGESWLDAVYLEREIGGASYFFEGHAWAFDLYAERPHPGALSRERDSS
jgi:hypothetical protein